MSSLPYKQVNLQRQEQSRERNIGQEVTRRAFSIVDYSAATMGPTVFFVHDDDWKNTLQLTSCQKLIDWITAAQVMDGWMNE